MSLITYLTRIHFADGVAEHALKFECTALGCRRLLVVTDSGVAAAGLLDLALEALPRRVKASVFEATPSQPTEKACLAGCRMYADNGCDGLIALGGGSVIDLAKAIAVLTSHGGSLASYMVVEGGIRRIRDVLPPLIAVPTTAGTGSEAGAAAVIVLDDSRKLTMMSPFLVPKAAICDPMLTLTLPPRLTAATGMDALTQCIETYLARAYNPPADGIAIEGLRRAAANIRRATEDGRNRGARREMMAAALNGALASQKGQGGVQSMSNALASLPAHSLHHGMLNAILLPKVLRFNEPAVGERYGLLRAALGVSEDGDPAAAVEGLTADLGLPTRLADLGLTRDDLVLAARLAENEHTHSTNPRRADAASYFELMELAL
jgi:hypothetical protein